MRLILVALGSRGRISRAGFALWRNRGSPRTTPDVRCEPAVSQLGELLCALYCSDSCLYYGLVQTVVIACPDGHVRTLSMSTKGSYR